MRKLSLVMVLCLTLISTVIFSGCAAYDFAETDQVIISAKEAIALMNQPNTVLVDMQSKDDYANGHIENAVNIPRSAINVDEPFSNMMAPKEIIEEVMGQSGISNDTIVIAYDNTNSMDASRLWWTLMVYGHENVKVISGGFKSLKSEGANVTKEVPSVSKTTFTASDLNTNYIAYKADVEAQVNEPDPNVCLLDTRTIEEYSAGTIPGSLHIDYVENLYKDGTFKSSRDIQIMYLEEGLKPENTAIMYCKTSIRAANTFVALWNAGYRNLKLYDGAWSEWSADENAPSDAPPENDVPVTSSPQDNS
jgi:thiosulfate/3-mercaptopyruvate sulfurtransferase